MMTGHSVEYGHEQPYEVGRMQGEAITPEESYEGEQGLNQEEKEKYLGETGGEHTPHLSEQEEAKIEAEKSIGVAKIEALCE
jgi:hypothetical protein